MFVGCVRGSDLIRSAFSSPSLPQNQPQLLYNRLRSAFLISTGFFVSFFLLRSLFPLFRFCSTNSLLISSICLIAMMACPVYPQIYCFPSSIRSTSFFCPPSFSTLFTFSIIWHGVSILFIIPWHDYPSTQWAVETKSVR